MTYLWLSSKDLHPDAEEARALGEANHKFHHRNIAWLPGKLLSGSMRSGGRTLRRRTPCLKA
ncbi:hypothetical protein NZK32_06500, partial [Cyanobium sp. FGCU-52]|nr:hypothetical protein [Cyanobium sp. FGCU52]